VSFLVFIVLDIKFWIHCSNLGFITTANQKPSLIPKRVPITRSQCEKIVRGPKAMKAASRLVKQQNRTSRVLRSNSQTKSFLANNVKKPSISVDHVKPIIRKDKPLNALSVLRKPRAGDKLFALSGSPVVGFP
jgi:Cell division cycle-associated protein 8